jgi:hypothetical protein
VLGNGGESRSETQDDMNRQQLLIGIAIALIVIGTVGTIIEIIPQIEALLLALAGRGYLYLAFGIAGGLLLFYARRKPSEARGATGTENDREPVS